MEEIEGLERKLLSQAGREILVKAIIQAIPTYTMSCFKLPKGLINDIESLIRKFWWGYHGEQRKIHWVSWEKMCRPKGEGGMGFRELSKFNDSLLAKQIWCLANNEKCLFHKVFKVKFFPNCSIMECENLNKWSNAWKSIIQAKHVIEVGRIWRVGNGDSIQIRGDKWLPKVSGSKVISTASGLPLDSRVCDIIDQDLHIWKSALIDQKFMPHEATMIKGIPLSWHNTQDKQVWRPSKHGEYTTRSAYQLLAQKNRNLLPGSSSDGGNKHFWKCIWSLQVPHKVKHLVWRAAKKALPTLHNLLRRKVVNSSYCPNCKSNGKDTGHALWSCRRLLVIWEDDEELMKLTRQKFMIFADLLAVLFMRKDRVDVDLLAVIWWLIWSRRNAARVGEPVFQFHQLWARAEQYLLEFKSAQVRVSRGMADTVRVAGWVPPIPNQNKINFDGAVFSDVDAVGLGVVIRDACGQVIGSLAEHIPIPNSAATVEALACRRALLFAKELSIFDTVCDPTITFCNPSWLKNKA